MRRFFFSELELRRWAFLLWEIKSVTATKSVLQWAHIINKKAFQSGANRFEQVRGWAILNSWTRGVYMLQVLFTKAPTLKNSDTENITLS